MIAPISVKNKKAFNFAIFHLSLYKRRILLFPISSDKNLLIVFNLNKSGWECAINGELLSMNSRWLGLDRCVIEKRKALRVGFLLYGTKSNCKEFKLKTSKVFNFMAKQRDWFSPGENIEQVVDAITPYVGNNDKRVFQAMLAFSVAQLQHFTSTNRAFIKNEKFINPNTERRQNLPQQTALL